MGSVNFVQGIPTSTTDTSGAGGTPSVRSITITPVPLPVMPDELKALMELKEAY
jgi:hypothetical protein